MKKKSGRAVACAGVGVSAAPQRRLTDQLPRRRAAMRNKFLLMFLLMAMYGQAAAWDDSLTADSTFSIIARDVAAGELGMAVQSKAHAVGSRTISARGGLAVEGMVKHFEAAANQPLAERLLAALDGGQAAGGDRRGACDREAARRCGW